MDKLLLVVPAGIIGLLLLLLVSPPSVPAVQPEAPGINVAEIHVEIPATNDVISAPLSEHAMRGHAQDAWNATSIQQHMKSGGCKPKMYFCPGQDFVVAYCQHNKDMGLGLIVGKTVVQVITGFMAPNSYWVNRCK